METDALGFEPDFEPAGDYLRRLQLRDDNRRELVFGVATVEQRWEAQCRMIAFLATAKDAA
jgi:hypothetical protein